jgi:hypothetical protein
MKICGGKRTQRWQATQPSIGKHKKRVSLQDPFPGRLGRRHYLYACRIPVRGGEDS